MKTACALAAVLVAAAALTGLAAAQPVDFSGTWRLDVEASTFPEPRRAFQGRGRGGNREEAGRRMARTVTITQDGERLVTEETVRERSRTVSYWLDGRTSTNDMGRGTLTSTSSWDGTALVTEGSLSMTTPRGNFTIDLVEHRSLSSDGRSMTVQSSRRTPFGEMDTTLVYRRND